MPRLDQLLYEKSTESNLRLTLVAKKDGNDLSPVLIFYAFIKPFWTLRRLVHFKEGEDILK